MGNAQGLPVCGAPDDTNGDFLIVTPCTPDSVWFASEIIPREDTQHFPQGSLVYLNVYHLSDDWLHSNQVSNQIFGIGGAFHAGIEVHGVEWTYGDEGISCNDPRTHQVHVYHESILLGETPWSANQVVDHVKRLQRFWQGEEYDVLEKNCCNFSDSLSQELVGEHIPAWVTRFPHIASKAAEHLDIDVKQFVQGMCQQPGDVSPARSDVVRRRIPA